MLGLRRHTVQLVPHNPAWRDRFRAAQRRIADATGMPRRRIQHVGSTAVCDLPAKPIIDIDLGITASEKIDDVTSLLTQVGFMDRGHKDGGIGRLLVWESAPDVRTIHIHIIPFGSEGWRRDMAFRDALRADEDLRRRYAKLKTQLAQRFPADRRSYRHAKDPFITVVLESLMASS